MKEVNVGTEKIRFDDYAVVVSRVETLAEGLLTIELSLLDKSVSFVPGQYMSVVYPGVKPAPFSIASSPEQHDAIELGVEVTGGPVTTRLRDAKVGDEMVLRGPFGRFTMHGEQKVCFLAGGVGVAPFMSMLRWIRDTKQPIDATLLYSCRDGRFLWLEEMQQMQEECKNIRVVFTCTREAPAGWMHNVGRVDEETIRSHVPDFFERTFFTCGPREFIDAMFSTLRKMGVPEERMRKEVW